MLGTLENKEKQDWKKYISSLVHAYNCTKHDSTGYSPYELMFGRKLRLPVDLAFGLPEEHNQTESYSEYITDLRNRIKETFELVKNTAESSRQKQKINFDKRAKAKKLSIGDIRDFSYSYLKVIYKISHCYTQTKSACSSQVNGTIRPVNIISIRIPSYTRGGNRCLEGVNIPCQPVTSNPFNFNQ